MAPTEAKKRANKKYIEEKTDDIRLRVPKGTKERWRKGAEKLGYSSLTNFVRSVVEKELEGRD